jgi:hypothetical protein
LYSGNLKAMLDKDLQTGDDLPHSIAYTINGEPGDFCDCSKGTFADFGVCLLILELKETLLGHIYCYI